MNTAEAPVDLPANFTDAPDDQSAIHTVAVSGLGVMGRGIVSAALAGGLRVFLHDPDIGRVDRVLNEGSTTSDRLRPVDSSEQFAEADLVIESIPEDLALKRSWLAATEPSLKPNAILATNTSSFTLGALADGLVRPERLCGLHFCHPVQERDLVEVVRGRRTSPETADAAVRFVEILGKRPMLVGDGPGFVLNRLLSLYLGEALELLQAGVDLPELNAAAAQLGMPLGPLQQVDQFGVELAVAVGRSLWQAFPDRWVPSELLLAVCRARRRARQVGLGFYSESEPGGRRSASAQLDPLALTILYERRRNIRSFSHAEIERRLWLPMLLEAFRILDDGLVAGLDDIDRILELGLGMQPGGFRLTERAISAGPEGLLTLLQPLRSIGGRFQPPASFDDHVGKLTSQPSRKMRAAS